jgi:hypothetical protein
VYGIWITKQYDKDILKNKEVNGGYSFWNFSFSFFHEKTSFGAV